MSVRFSSTMRRLAAAVIAVATLGSMAACGSGSNSSSSNGDETLSFSAWDKLPDSWFAGFKKKYPNIKVKFVNIPGDNYNQKINQMVVGGNAPDVMLLQEADYVRFAKNGVLEDLSGKMKGSKAVSTSDLIPAVSALNSQTGGLYGLPWCVASEILYYNKDMFDAAGVQYPTKDWTWDDYAAAAQKLSKGDSQWGADAITFNGIWYSMAGQAGDKVVDKGQLALGDGAKKALEFQNKMTNDLKVSPQPSSGNTVSDLFAAGKAAMTLNGSWNINSAYKDVPFKWDVATLPIAPGGTHYDSLHTGFFTINAKSKMKDAAWKFIEYYMSKDGQKVIEKNTGNLSAVKSISADGGWKVQGKNGPSNWTAVTDSVDQGKFGYTTVNSTPTTDLSNQFNAYLLGQTPLNNVLGQQLQKANKALKDTQQ
ncbi:sugar ABC transporter substrate-binding protein [Bifidobacterium sp. ESL0732]|uniref:ABC transporter substrate-binding protein n=1 Tax=Bifidobacterium sp. ESL0732 TaxID=2983222 RepID=UPI0023F78CD8|nr:sugar ABC transporter substrate-binding protein [Bifidobacterium sp. ESL0732]WEV63733.1 sugar ABC transporter substrate-binding protein [Bifidobacterium sp. ESL0732]